MQHKISIALKKEILNNRPETETSSSLMYLLGAWAWLFQLPFPAVFIFLTPAFIPYLSRPCIIATQAFFPNAKKNVLRVLQRKDTGTV